MHSGPSGNNNSNGHSGFSGSNGAKQKYGQHNQQYDGCHDGQYSQRQDGGRGGQHNDGGRSSQNNRINPAKCAICSNEHPFLFYCEDYIKAKVSERFDMVKAQRTCGRCLTMARKFTNRKSDWRAAHEGYCKTSFACKEGLCAGKLKERQLHMTICFTHATENRAAEPDFIKSLDSKELPSGFSLGNLWFLHMLG